MEPKCVHCLRRCQYARGLCESCYRKPHIREGFADGRTARRYRPLEDEPTEEELERMIAEQMQCLPAWWPKDGETDADE